MKIKENVSFRDYTTIKLGGNIKFLGFIETENDIIEADYFRLSNNIPVLPLGAGSNLLVSDKLKDLLVLKMENKNLQILSEDSKSVLVKASAGFMLDDFVEWSVSKNFSGIESLSSIPGTVGATPIQNVGAYGCEVSSVIKNIRFYSLEMGKFLEISARNCLFGYRDSIFKNKLKNNSIIESVVFELKKVDPEVPKYPKVLDVFEEIKKSNSYNSKTELIRMAIKRIRSEKLPDPIKVPNVGSFFKNVFIEKGQLEKILKIYPDMPNFLTENCFKIPSGWLIEQAGFKGLKVGGVEVYNKNALVLINNSAKSADELLDFASTIQKSVFDKFGLFLEIEPEIIL